MSAARTVIYPLAHLAVRMLVHVLAPRLRITGRRHLPHSGPVIVISNHLSHIDSPLLACGIRRPLWFMAMSEMFENPNVAALARFAGAFPVERNSADRSSLGFAQELLRRGQVIVIYPEGKLSATGELGKVLPGAAMLALQANVPIIPAGIAGSTSIMPYGPTLPRPSLSRVRVHFGAPLDFSAFDSLSRRERRRAATAEMENAIRHCTAIAQGG